MIDPSQLLAAARITGYDSRKRKYNFTFGGDSLKSIKFPNQFYLLILKNKSISSHEVLKPAVSGLTEDMGEYIPITVNSINLMKDKGQLKLDELSENKITEFMDRGELKGSWICMDKSLLEESPDLYVFEFIHSEIFESESSESIAKVVDYFNNGAHGIIVAQTKDGSEVLIPFIDQFARFDKKSGRMLIPGFKDFLQS